MGIKQEGPGKSRSRSCKKTIYQGPLGLTELIKSAGVRLQFVTARESSLFLFHALGKVLYNKREPTA